MKLTNIIEIKDLSPNNLSDTEIKKVTSKVNEYLNVGWTLIEVYKVDYGDPNKQNEIIHYIIGMDKKTKENINRAKINT